MPGVEAQPPGCHGSTQAARYSFQILVGYEPWDRPSKLYALPHLTRSDLDYIVKDQPSSTVNKAIDLSNLQP